MASLSSFEYLKTTFPNVYNILQSENTQQQPEHITSSVVSNQSAQTNILTEYKNKKSHLHNFDDPQKEAQQFLGLLAGEQIDHMVFYGIGMGYHIQYFKELFPHTPYSVYEPHVEIAKQFVSSISKELFDDVNWRTFEISTFPNQYLHFLQSFIDRTPGTVSLAVLPSYEYLFEQEAKIFKEAFEQMLDHKRNNMMISQKFSMHWVENSFRNFKHVCNTPNIFQKKMCFKDKPVVLVSAGPSLEEEIPYLRQIKENQSAYIFTAGSSLSVLINHGIYPDAACSYDPNPLNYRVVDKVKSQKITQIPLIFGSSIGQHILDEYPGEKLHFITTQDTISSYFFPANQTGYPIVQDASSIAIMALQILSQLECGLIMLVGQNFAYHQGNQYASGIDYVDPTKQFDQKLSIQTTDVEGHSIYSNTSFLSMKKEMEVYIKMLKKTNIINTTKGGAAIAGTTFMPLQNVVDQHLVANTIDSNWMHRQEKLYSLHHIEFAKDQLEQDHLKVQKSMVEMQHIFKDIRWYVQEQQLDSLSKLFPIFDIAFERLLKNAFSKMILIPMNRVHYERLYQQVENVFQQQDPVKKAEAILYYYGSFMQQIENSYTEILPLYEQL